MRRGRGHSSGCGNDDHPAATAMHSAMKGMTVSASASVRRRPKRSSSERWTSPAAGYEDSPRNRYPRTTTGRYEEDYFAKPS